ncbi:hypothetical protein KL942_002408 [Ogataea angusta]|uniref:FAD-binding FR-type domain-containing protein n=1 Tax=Pichia angusta TaxID=870730 RepID=A0ABQ7RZ27_PICAN|nr:hypothetical protein KL942_002408 [Ogataea angusta]KAG7850365.1 hypothetical protein KL940_001925 [Ogataea angusta]
MPSISEGEPSISTSVALSSATISSPFGLPLDPYELKGRVLTSPFNVLLSAIYLLNDKIFSYDLLGHHDVPDRRSLLGLWNKLNRKNLNNNVPHLYNLEVRSGCGNLILGYLNESIDGQPVSVIVPSSGLEYMEPVLLQQNQNHHNLALSLNVASLEYDFKSGQLVSQYSKVLSVAKNLKLPVLHSLDAVEAQHFAILTNALAKLKITTVHLFDGLSFLKTNQTISGSLSNERIRAVADELYEKLNGKIQLLPAVSKLSFALSVLNEVLGTSYAPFEYHGPQSAETVYVAYGSKETALLKRLNVAFVHVRTALPFEVAKFVDLVPASTKQVVVIGEKYHGVNLLKLDVQAALYVKQRFLKVVEETVAEFERLAASAAEAGSHFRFLTADNSPFVDVPSKITHALSLVPDMDIQYRPKFDNTVNSGVFSADIRTGSVSSDLLDVLVVEDAQILNEVDVLKSLKKTGSLLVVNGPEQKFDEVKFVEKTLSSKFKARLLAEQRTLKVIDLNTVGEQEATKGRTASIAIQVAFWKLAYPELDTGAIVTKILQAFGSEAELLASVIAELVEKVEQHVSEVAVKEVGEEDEQETKFVDLVETSFEPNPREKFVDTTGVKVEPRSELVRKLMFKEAYGVSKALRPDLPVQNFVVKVKENKRLTPTDYDRNIFHIEFDVSGTGLKYNIGEALGIHGRNSPEIVDQFIQMYGLEPDALVEVASKEDETVFEVRTVRQALIENLDVLGKPPKRFYESLAEYATNADEKATLTKLGGADGAELLKTYQEEEFYSYVDIFELFPSARPSAEELVQLIPALKRREYSIASSQKLHPNEVHLLVVVVDWKDKKGRTRYGQCSKYLSDLRIGEELVVSVKTSIMKLPPLTTQPIIMAGLGTGLAPFKAFVEERYFQQTQGHEIGEIYLYLGSRHKRQEYLYGEYWEAYLNSGIMTYIGAAFSRDQPKKVYIQDKIRENLEELTDLMISKKGHFYLCGPTWPVPDITACLQDILEADAAKKGVQIDSAKEVEELKEDGRYVLEVY